MSHKIANRFAPGLHVIQLGLLLCCVCSVRPAFATDLDDRMRSPVGQFGTSFGDGQFFGGAGQEFLDAITHTADGNIVICGTSTSFDIGTAGAAYPQHAESTNEFLVDNDVFVAKFDGETGAVLFGSYLGGTGDEFCRAIAADADGNVIVGGLTDSADFPTVNAFDGSFAGGGTSSLSPGHDAFVTKFSADGSNVLFSTFLGGDDNSHVFAEDVRGIAVAPDNSIYVTGSTNATDFPSTFLIDDHACLDGQSPTSSFQDIFLTKFSATGTLQYSTCLGGENADRGRGIAVNPSGRVILSGHTRSEEFALVDATYSDLPDTGFTGYDVFVVEFDESSMALDKRLRIGGSDSDFVSDLKLGSNGTIYIGGTSNSDDFPTTTDAYQQNITPDPETGFPQDMMVISVLPTLTGLNFATYIGGEKSEFIAGMELDDQNQLWFSSPVSTFELPTFNAPVAEELKELSGEMQFGAETVGANAIVTTFHSGPPYRGVFFARNGQNYVAGMDAQTPDVYWIHPTGPATGDSRTAAASTNGSNDGQLVIGNYGGANQYYNDLFDEPVDFGASDGNTTHLAMSNVSDFSGGLIYEANEGQANNAYTFDSFFPFDPITQVGTFGDPADETVGLVLYEATLVEAVAPNRLRIYHDDLTPHSEFVLDGMNIVELRNAIVADVEQRLLITNSAGPSEIAELIFDFPTDSYSLGRTVVDPDQPDFVSMYSLNAADLLAHDGSTLHRYRVDTDGSITKTGEFPSSTTDARFSTSYAQTLTGNVPIASQSGPAIFRHVSPDNLYLGALSSDGSDLVFGEYGGGDGSDFCCELSIAPSGKLFLGGTTVARTFTGVSSLNSTGQRQAVITALAYPLDEDQDSVSDLVDNCQLVANPLQQDTNSDGIGNACDPDLNDDNIVNFVDLNAVRLAIFTSPGHQQWNPDADFNSDLIVNFTDLDVMRAYFFGPPGPAAESL